MKTEPFFRQNESTLMIKEWESFDASLKAGFSTRVGGTSVNGYNSLNVGLHVNDIDSNVIKNREKIAEILRIPLNQWVFSDQVHKAQIHHVTKSDKGKGAFNYENAIKATDGLYTREKGIMLALCYADCVPVYFYAPSHQLIGIVHAGWKGTVENIVGQMISTWTKNEGVSTNDIYIAIGPSIEECCYIVDDRVIEALTTLLGDQARHTFKEVSTGQYRLNLKLANQIICEKNGIDSNHILVSKDCTSCNEELFFSHRRDKGSTGRMMSFIGFEEDES
ncbi:peptidoglycan editing factor PgeF [Bacillus kexueae]|uniref:peptidoglycan editing factor PgeF n=1 Tax=Aeribacillus kexueae TaxID=2078952 RepID=UPI001FAFDFAD|nr:peptidoglycan editing factor PgeF [Bacillus kexueae]